MQTINKQTIDNASDSSKLQSNSNKTGNNLQTAGLECGAFEKVALSSIPIKDLALLHPTIRHNLNSSEASLTIPRKYFCKVWMKTPNANRMTKTEELHKLIGSHLPPEYSWEESIVNKIYQLSIQLASLWDKSAKNGFEDWLKESPIQFKLKYQKNDKKTSEQQLMIKTHTAKSNPNVNLNPQPQQKPDQTKPQTSAIANPEVNMKAGLNVNLNPRPQHIPEPTNPQTSAIVTPEVNVKLEKYADILDLLKTSIPPLKPDELVRILTTGDDLKDLNEEDKDIIVKFANRIVSDIRFKWLTANGKEKVFEEKFGYWLQLNIKWPDCLNAIITARNVKYDAEMKASILSQSHKQTYLEKSVVEKLSEVGCNDISEVIHRLVQHPEEAASIKEFVAQSHCRCNNTGVDDDIEVKSERSSPDRDDPLKLTLGKTQETTDTPSNRPGRKYHNPSNAQRLMLKTVLDKLKATNNIKEPIYKSNEASDNVEENSEDEEDNSEDEEENSEDKSDEEAVLDKLKATNNIKEPIYKSNEASDNEEGNSEDEEDNSEDEEENSEDKSDEEAIEDNAEVCEVETLDQEEDDLEVDTVDQEEDYLEVETLDQEDDLEVVAPDQHKVSDEFKKVSTPISHGARAHISKPIIKTVFNVLPGHTLQSLDFGPVLNRTVFLSCDTVGPDILKNFKDGKIVTINRKVKGTIHKISNLKSAVAIIPVLNNKIGMNVLPRRTRVSKSGPMLSTPTKNTAKPPNGNSISDLQQLKEQPVTTRRYLVVQTPTNIDKRLESLVSTQSTTPSNMMSLQKTATYVNKNSSQMAVSSRSLHANMSSPLKVTSSGVMTLKRPILPENINITQKARPKSPVFTYTKKVVPLKLKNNDDEPPSKKTLLNSYIVQ